jgi:hypothetical protein
MQFFENLLIHPGLIVPLLPTSALFSQLGEVAEALRRRTWLNGYGNPSRSRLDRVVAVSADRTLGYSRGSCAGSACSDTNDPPVRSIT